jgi:hypothetical protein
MCRAVAGERKEMEAMECHTLVEPEPAQVQTVYISGIEAIDSVECCTVVTAYVVTPVDGKRERRINLRLVFPTVALPHVAAQAIAYLQQETEAASRTTN